jgi:hypothetical protein
MNSPGEISGGQGSLSAHEHSSVVQKNQSETVFQNLPPRAVDQSGNWVGGPAFMASLKGQSDEYVPQCYDIVSRGNIPAIVFHKNEVQLVYQIPMSPASV